MIWSVQVINGTHPLTKSKIENGHGVPPLPSMTAPCARRLRDRRQAQCLVCGHGARGLCFRYLWFGEPVGALQETMEGVEELARRRTIIRRFGLYIFQPPCGCHTDMSPKALPTVQVVDTTHRHWSIDQHRSLPHPTVARQNMLLAAHLFAGHARRTMNKFHSCFLEKNRVTDIVSSALQRHLHSTFCWHNTPPLADSSLSTRYSATFLWHCTCARL